MEFLDPKKMRSHQIRLLVGYVLMAIAVVLAATLLLDQAQGFGLKDGKVIQKGLVFVRSSPGSADVELNGRRIDTTEARLEPEAGAYTLKLTRDGYHDWQRALTVEGGSVQHVSYPWLIPRQLASPVIANYETLPALATQSPDRRWLIVQQPGQLATFDVYDAKDPEQTALQKKPVALPAGIFGIQPGQASRLEVEDWSNDNKHLLLRHISGDQSEYLLFARDTPATSVNLTRTFGLTPGLVLTLQDKKHDQYFIHDPVTKTLSTLSLSDPQSVPMLTGVLAYETYGTDTVLYVTPSAEQPGKVQLRLYENRRQYAVRTMEPSPQYLLAMSRYDRSWLLMAGSPVEDRVYVYRDAGSALADSPERAPVPVAVLKVADPTDISFSANSQLLMAQRAAPGAAGVDIAVYDAEYDRSHTYRIERALDAPQSKVSWLDSHHLHYVSSGRSLVFDYDGTNTQVLGAQDPALPAMFDTGYVTLYGLSRPTPSVGNPAPTAGLLTATPLRTAEDR